MITPEALAKINTTELKTTNLDFLWDGRFELTGESVGLLVYALLDRIEKLEARVNDLPPASAK